MLLATALALLITGCAQQDVYCSKQTGSSSTKGKPSPIISSFLELGRRKLSMQPKFGGGAEMLLKQKPSNICKWIARFYYLAFILRWKRAYCSIIA